MSQTIRIRGTRADVLTLKNELEKQFTIDIKISEITPYTGRLNAREAYRQNELFDIIIAIATNVISTIAYEQIKTIIDEYRQKRNVEVHYENNSEGTAAKKEITQQPPSHDEDIP